MIKIQSLLFFFFFNSFLFIYLFIFYSPYSYGADHPVEETDKLDTHRYKCNTRDLFKKTGDTKGTFGANTGTIKDRKSKDLTEVEEIKERCQE